MKKFLIISLVALLLAGAAVFVYVFFLMPKTDTPSQEAHTESGANMTMTYANQEEQKRNQDKKDASLYNDAIRSQNIQTCENIENPERKNQCRNAINSINATKTNNPELCNQISDTGANIECHDSIEQRIATETNDKSHCEKIQNSSLKANCISTIDASTFRAMIASGSITEAGCKNLGTEYRDECFTELKKSNDNNAYARAISSGNMVYCSIITNQELKNTCSDTLLIKQALSSNNSALCEKITNQEKRTYCQSHIATKSQTDLFREYVSGTDIHACNAISDESLRNRCHDMVTITVVKNTKNTTLCQGLTNTGMIASCKQITQ